MRDTVSGDYNISYIINAAGRTTDGQYRQGCQKNYLILYFRFDTIHHQLIEANILLDSTMMGPPPCTPTTCPGGLAASSLHQVDWQLEAEAGQPQPPYKGQEGASGCFSQPQIAAITITRRQSLTHFTHHGQVSNTFKAEYTLNP